MFDDADTDDDVGDENRNRTSIDIHGRFDGKERMSKCSFQVVGQKGTHSFRRGGCQFFNLHCNWSLKQIAMWGGWSVKRGEEMNFSVVCRYLNDYHEENSRFLNPMHPDNMFRSVIVVQRCY